ncbi:TerC family protein [Haliscomenobacter hydrossis]|uniref:Integral membrane protein TerC n=1 Tax=Haliscomenobacter hydrossis (strain ATCC 27775 / DSM 1100 / LMG 10767 / O) TaxID=760192 RepID=F4KPX8_HALH1|nr:TerC family protein [Haliscomenobacter hydrossis]AEE53182.1 Integral membrane protein TerC [Haliscomenobacter hydrossis DSM 1100]
MEATSFILPNFADPQVWISLLTLTFLEIVLGVDNIIFISIAANKLAPADQAKARNIGMILAMVFRIILLFGISALIAMQNPVLSFHGEYLHGAFTGQSLILIAGGLFLLYKATSEIHHKLEGAHAVDDDMNQGSRIFASLSKVVVQIALINIVFSFDSILTAVGLTDSLAIMIVSVVISMLIMMAFAGPVGRFVNTHPTIQMLGLAFLIMIGFMLIAEGAHLAHLSIAGSEVGSVPKGYLYFSIAFSLFVEALNMRLRKKQDPVQLRGYQEEAIQEGVMKP